MIFQIDLNNETMPMPLRVSRPNRKIKHPILMFIKFQNRYFASKPFVVAIKAVNAV
jgi:hypothetical protein